MSATIRIPATSSNRGEDGKSKRWCKILSSVEPTAKNGYGFIGGFVNRGELVNSDEVPDKSILLENAGNNGSAKYPRALLILWKRAGAEFEEIARAEGDEWAFELRDKAIDALKKPAIESNLSTIDDDKLLALRDCLAQAVKIAQSFEFSNSEINAHVERTFNFISAICVSE